MVFTLHLVDSGVYVLIKLDYIHGTCLPTFQPFPLKKRVRLNLSDFPTGFSLPTVSFSLGVDSNTEKRKEFTVSADASC